MVKLFCAVVGKAGCAFRVEMNTRQAVDTLKKTIKATIPRMITCDAAQLRLYLAKQGDAWLTSAGADAVTLDAHRKPQGVDANGTRYDFEKMDPTAWIEDDCYFGTNFEPSEGQVHVLVVVPRDEGKDAKRRRTTGTCYGVLETPPPTETMDVVPSPVVLNKNYMTVPAALMFKCGLLPPQADTVMVYRRPQVQDLWHFVQNQVIAKSAMALIVGPCGVGKSLATLCCVAQLDPNEWHVVWIHFGAFRNPCLSMGTREYWQHVNLPTFVLPRVNGKRLFLCLDGYDADPAQWAFVQRILVDFTTDDRLVLCCAMATEGKLNYEDAKREKIRVFPMDSWTRDEYEAAVADAALYDQVVTKLDATTTTEGNVETESDEDEDDDKREADTKKKNALDRKFYYAGGSCRFMFQRTTAHVKQTLQRAMASTMDTTDLVHFGFGSWHHDPLETLFGMVGGRRRFPVSSYAAFLLANHSRVGVGATAQLASRLATSETSCVDGPRLEWLVLMSVSKEAATLIGGGGVRDELPRAPVLPFDPTKRFQVSDGQLTGTTRWWQPIVWNHGGYDALYVDHDNGVVLFVHVMRSDTYRIQMRFFHDVLMKLAAATMTIKTVEIYVVVKSARSVESARGQVDDRGLLCQFDARWTEPEETHVKVRAVEAVGHW